MKKMFNFLFTDLETSEEFIVQADNRKIANEIAESHFSAPKCFGRVSDEQAERMGIDIY